VAASPENYAANRRKPVDVQGLKPLPLNVI
jgi:hypothetical protein